MVTANRAWTLLATALLVFFFAQPVLAQNKEFWPGVDVYVNLNPKMRLYFSGAGTNENGSRTDYDFGVSLDFYAKPLKKLRRSRVQQDESKSKLLLLRAGYHYLGGARESRIVLEGIARYPLGAASVVSLRNRVELRFINGEFSSRYRFRPAIERSLGIWDYHITPYARAEFYYDSIYKKWSRTALTAGCVFPIRKHFEIEAYFEHQNRTEVSPNRQARAIGLQLNLYF